MNISKWVNSKLLTRQHTAHQEMVPTHQASGSIAGPRSMMIPDQSPTLGRQDSMSPHASSSTPSSSGKLTPKSAKSTPNSSKNLSPKAVEFVFAPSPSTAPIFQSGPSASQRRDPLHYAPSQDNTTIEEPSLLPTTDEVPPSHESRNGSPGRQNNRNRRHRRHNGNHRVQYGNSQHANENDWHQNGPHSLPKPPKNARQNPNPPRDSQNYQQQSIPRDGQRAGQPVLLPRRQSSNRNNTSNLGHSSNTFPSGMSSYFLSQKNRESSVRCISLVLQLYASKFQFVI
jgi:hypothetical protein